MIFLDIQSALNLMIAYLDPGSGSIFIQLLISALIGVGIYLRARWGKIKELFGKGSRNDEENEIVDEDFDV